MKAVSRTKSLSRLALVLLPFFLSAACAHATDAQQGLGQPVASPTPAAIPGVEKVLFQDGTLSVTAKEADIRRLFEVVGERAGVTVHLDQGVQGKVSAEFSNKTFQEGLDLILGSIDARNYLAGYDRHEAMTAVWILPKGADATLAEEDLRLRRFNEEDKKYLVEKYKHLPSGVRAVLKKLYPGKPMDLGWSDSLNRVEYISLSLALDAAIVETPERALAYGKEFLSRYENLLRARMQGLQLLGPTWVDSGKDYQSFTLFQYFGHVPVEGARSFLIVSTTAVTFGNGTLPDVAVSTEPKLSVEEAIRFAEAQHRKTYLWREPPKQKYDDLWVEERIVRKTPSLVVWHKGNRAEKPTAYSYFLAYEVAYLSMTYWIDAHDGRVLGQTSNVMP